jgi:D-sedoheptulose 7-phosphate isomerase
MPLARIIADTVEEHDFLRRRFFERQGETFLAAARQIIKAYREGRKALFFGNGGSASQAEHLAAEFVGRFERDRASLPAVALTCNSSAMTAIANDYGFERIFARQIEAWGERGDVAIGLTTSGNSPNVIEAMRMARERGLITVGFLGRDGGKLREMVDYPLVVEGSKTARIQEIHILMGHIVCDLVERSLFEKLGS